MLVLANKIAVSPQDPGRSLRVLSTESKSSSREYPRTKMAQVIPGLDLKQGEVSTVLWPWTMIPRSATPTSFGTRLGETQVYDKVSPAYLIGQVPMSRDPFHRAYIVHQFKAHIKPNHDPYPAQDSRLTLASTSTYNGVAIPKVVISCSDETLDYKTMLRIIIKGAMCIGWAKSQGRQFEQCAAGAAGGSPMPLVNIRILANGPSTTATGSLVQLRLPKTSFCRYPAIKSRSLTITDKQLSWIAIRLRRASNVPSFRKLYSNRSRSQAANGPSVEWMEHYQPGGRYHHKRKYPIMHCDTSNILGKCRHVNTCRGRCQSCPRESPCAAQGKKCKRCILLSHADDEDPGKENDAQSKPDSPSSEGSLRQKFETTGHAEDENGDMKLPCGEFERSEGSEVLKSSVQGTGPRIAYHIWLFFKSLVARGVSILLDALASSPYDGGGASTDLSYVYSTRPTFITRPCHTGFPAGWMPLQEENKDPKRKQTGSAEPVAYVFASPYPNNCALAAIQILTALSSTSPRMSPEIEIWPELVTLPSILSIRVMLGLTMSRNSGSPHGFGSYIQSKLRDVTHKLERRAQWPSNNYTPTAITQTRSSTHAGRIDE
ncbi:uncharacterized protein FSUBG_6159 [Fusarium subglutinans]|uniref:Uncharacterized protein n=1 Tax=Gibberella subglutinans TaxID=42677 RepID=A0A8H5PZ45_GIBSU|nr:uncharacterized protein FSUBG_6159 [Fusarium subglutinans]KAF5606325.1 hypothetical protein FSUBG_6159 [Fusarium subglutinans]